MRNVPYRTVRHGLKVRLSYMRNIIAISGLRRRLLRERPNRKIVAVMLLEQLGDIVACEPVARHLRAKDPDAFIFWGVKQAYRELIDSNPHIDALLVIHCLTERLLIRNSGLFDEVIDLHFPDRFCSLCRSPLRKEQGASGINLTNYFNHGSLLSSMAQGAGLPGLDESPKVYIPENTVKKVGLLGLPQDFIVVNCTSNAEEKNWPRGNWHTLIKKISETFGIPVVEIGLVSLIGDNPHVIDLCGKLSILESAEVIRRAKLFLGIDSGPAHLANAVGTAGIVLLGRYLGFERYNPFSGPYRNGSAAMLYAEGAAATISTDRVFDEFRRALSLL